MNAFVQGVHHRESEDTHKINFHCNTPAKHETNEQWSGLKVFIEFASHMVSLETCSRTAGRSSVIQPVSIIDKSNCLNTHYNKTLWSHSVAPFMFVDSTVGKYGVVDQKITEQKKSWQRISPKSQL